MRKFIAVFLAMALTGCIAGEITGGEEGGGDDMGGGGQGDGNGDGDGDGNNPPPPDPRITASLDKSSIATELGKTEVVVLTLTSVDGFAGTVSVAVAALDGSSAPLSGLIVEGPATVTLAADQMATATYELDVSSNATGTSVSGSLKLDLSSSVGSESLTATLAVEPNYTIAYAAGTGATVDKHPVLSGSQPKNVTVKRGAVIRYVNDDTVQHDTHGGGIFDHQGNGGGQPGTTYEQRTIGAAPGSTGDLGCHDHGGTAGYVRFTIE